jgi:hypothetical protein
MLHACVERFDVMGERRNILGWEGEVNKAYVEAYKAACQHCIIFLAFAASSSLPLPISLYYTVYCQYLEDLERS